MRKLFIFIVLLLFDVYQAQESEYSKGQKNHDKKFLRDSTELSVAKHNIQKAKSKKKYPDLADSYSIAAFTAPSRPDRLRYADSAVTAALLSRNNITISKAFLCRGNIYHFSFRKYKPALEEYLNAYEYSRNSSDDYLKNTLLFYMSVMKSHLGYYDSALKDFEKTAAYFAVNTQSSSNHDIILNSKKIYYNSLHRMIICYRNLGQFESIDSLVAAGLSHTENNPDFDREYGYFLKEKGIEELRLRNYDQALKCLNKALLPMMTNNDFAWTPVCFYYIGRIYETSGQIHKAVKYFQKVDSIFQMHQFILPELRGNFEHLIRHYKSINDHRQELYYTNQLLKADRMISKDFAYLSSTIHREYETADLVNERDKLERKATRGIILVIGLALLALASIFIIFKNIKNQRNVTSQTKILSDPISETTIQSEKIDCQQVEEDVKCPINDDMARKILSKLNEFEEKLGFVELGLTINKLADKFCTNSTYLSQVINQYKGMNFNRYLGELRIKYITEKLYNDKKYLNYKIEVLAQKCGIASRTNFSNLFREINGLRPAEFINKLKRDAK